MSVEMIEHTHSTRRIAKRIPGAKAIVNFLRQQRKFAAEIAARTYLSRLKHYFWRAVHFDNLKAPLAVSNHPRENYLVNTQDKIIGKLLYCRGDFDFQKFQRAAGILGLEDRSNRSQKKPVLFDIGANIGSIGIPAIKRGYVDHVIAFEPDPDNFRLLRINAILNNVDDKIECHQVALGGETGEAELFKSTDNHGDHRIHTPLDAEINSGTEPASHSVKIAIHKLDDFLSDFTDCILWIDVQGFEAHVLSGATAALQKTYPLIIEFTPKDLIENGTMDDLLKHLTGNAYTRFFNLDDPSLAGIDLNKENILELGRILEEHDSFTDILVL